MKPPDTTVRPTRSAGRVLSKFQRPEIERILGCRRCRLLLWAVLGLLLTIVFVLSPVRNAWGDTSLTIPTARSLLRTGDLSLSEFQGSPLLNHYGIQIVDGNPVNFFPWVVAFFAIPVVALNDLLHQVGFGNSSYQLIMNADTWDLENLSASLTVALAVVVAAELMYQRLSLTSASRRFGWSLLGAMTLAFGTSVWSVASRSLWQHGPALLLVMFALLVATHLGRRIRADYRTLVLAALMGGILAVAYTTRPTNAVGLALFALWCLKRNWRILLSYVAGSSLVLTMWMTFNSINGLGPLPSYSNTSRLSLHPGFREALVANLISPARGLFIFSPILLLSFVGLCLVGRDTRRDHLEYFAFTAAVATWIGVSMFPHWWGGHSYGPRLMMDVLPYLFLASIPAIAVLDQRLQQRTSSNRHVFTSPALLVILVLSGWSVLAHAQGALMGEPACWNRVPVDVDQQPDRVWSWSDAQVTSGLRSILVGTSRTQQRDRCM